jgi:hypothetical protein
MGEWLHQEESEHAVGLRRQNVLITPSALNQEPDVSHATAIAKMLLMIVSSSLAMEV